MAQTSYIKYPFGAAEKKTVAYGAAIASEVNCNMSQLTIAQMTGNATLNLTVNSEMEAGSTLMVKVSADGTNRTLTLGTNMTGNAITITASKSFLIVFYYDGSKYLHQSTQVLN